MRKKVVILVTGFVQGVFYRSSALEIAKKLDLTGFVKNEESDSVRIVAEGGEDNLRKFVEWTEKGPFLAKVDKIDVKWDKDQAEFNNFEIAY